MESKSYATDDSRQAPAGGTARETASGQRPVLRPRVHNLIRDGLERYGLVFICAPARMGKTMAVEREMAVARRHGVAPQVVELAGKGPEQVRRRLLSLQRRLEAGVRPGRGAMVVIEDVPTGDDRDVARTVASIAQIAAMGADTIVTLDVDGEVIAEQFAQAARLTTRDLLVTARECGGWSVAFETFGTGEVVRVSHGIPALVDALRPSGQRFDPIAACGSGRFVREVAREAMGQLAGPMMEEERLLRMAMVLLGTGSFTDLERLGLRTDPLLLSDMQAYAPFFGISPDTSRFSCVASSHDAYDGAFARIQADQPGLVRKALALLSERERHERMGRIAAMLGDGLYRSELVMGHPIELVDAGQLALVSDVVRSWTAASADGPQAGREGSYGILVSRIALECLEGRASRLPRLCQELPPAGTQDERAMRMRVGLMVYSRRLRVGLPSSWPDDAASALAREALAAVEEGADHLAESFAAHVTSRELLLEARPHEAFRVLVTCGANADGTTLSSSLLVEDLELARMLVGDPRTPLDERASRQADSFCERSGLRDLLVMRRGVGGMLAAVEGGADEWPGLDALLAREARRGDDLSRAWTLVAAAMGDVRRGAGKRGLIRARQAGVLARSAGATRCAQYAGLLALAATMRLGESPLSECSAVPRPAERGSASAELLLSMLSCVEDRPSELEGLCAAAEDVPCDPYVALALELAVDVPGPMPARLGEMLPTSWKEAVVGVRTRRELERAAREEFGRMSFGGMLAAGASPADEDDSSVLDISLLGGFSVRLGGTLVPQRSWHRRAAPAILANLAVTKGHSCRRADLIEALWPGCDYAKGKNALYVVVSAIRKTLGQAGGEARYVSFTGDSVSLNMDNVRVDIDQLEVRCRRILAQGTDDATTVELSREIEALYAGDLYVPDHDPTGRFVARREQLRKTFTDAMVSGARSAAALGRHTEALYHARNAQEASPLREDVVVCVMEALRAQGREAEAKSTYEEFASEVIFGTGTPPSAHLREVFMAARDVVEHGDRTIAELPRRQREAEDDGRGCDTVPA